MPSCMDGSVRRCTTSRWHLLAPSAPPAHSPTASHTARTRSAAFLDRSLKRCCWSSVPSSQRRSSSPSNGRSPWTSRCRASTILLSLPRTARGIGKFAELLRDQYLAMVQETYHLIEHAIRNEVMLSGAEPATLPSLLSEREMRSAIQFLLDTPLTAHLSEAAARKLLSVANRVYVKSGDTILVQGALCNKSMYILVVGGAVATKEEVLRATQSLWRVGAAGTACGW
eukprot:SAG11_NODE_159_length_14027_cov_6.893667_10_plen_227_part_00